MALKCSRALGKLVLGDHLTQVTHGAASPCNADGMAVKSRIGPNFNETVSFLRTRIKASSVHPASWG